MERAEPYLQGFNAYAVTLSDTVNVTYAGSSGATIFVGVGGDISVDTIGGQTAVVFKNMASGSILPVRCIRVRATSTTATNCVAIS